MNEDYKTIPQVDLALIRAGRRRREAEARFDIVGMATQRHVTDRLLDRRLELMAARDKS